MKLYRYLPRWVNRLIAKIRGEFWIPCPICDKPFGGHESAETLLMGTSRLYRIDHLVCWRCEERARMLNSMRWAEIEIAPLPAHVIEYMKPNARLALPEDYFVSRDLPS